jgi:RimJ/RimL family protein N-acetyltransferase
MASFPARDWDAHVAHWNKILRDDSAIARTIAVGNEVAGNIVTWVQDGHREIGYWIGRSHWGKGIATAAVAEFVALVTERPLYAWVAEHNVGSIRVLEKCGLRPAAEQPEVEPDDVRHVFLQLPS